MSASVHTLPSAARSRWCRLVLVCWLGLTVRASHAQAEPDARTTYSLSWVRDEGAETCINPKRLATLLEGLVGPVIRLPSDAERALEGIVQRQHDRWHVRIRVMDAAGRELGRRELDSIEADCGALDRSILLVTALAIAPPEAQSLLPAALARAFALENDPAATLLGEITRSPPSPVVASAPTPAGPVVVPPPLVRTDDPSLRSRRVLAGELSLVGSMAVGLVPGVRPGAQLGGRLRLPWRASLALTVHYVTRSTIALPEGADAVFRVFDSTFALCSAILEKARWQFDLCAGGVAGARFIHSTGLAIARDPARPYWGPSLGGEVRLALGSPWFALASARAHALWPRDRFVYGDGSGREFSMFSPSRFAGTVGLGLGARFL